MWKLRIEQYFQVQDHALWYVIKNGNSFNPVPRITANADGTSTLTVPGPVTTKENAQKKNNVKARSMLLMALPNEHLLTFSQYKNAKTLFEAIQARFGGNDAIKKTQKTLLKQMYENFNAPSTESLDSIFNRRFPAKWNTHIVVWRNKADLDTISFDDLYNNFKIVKQEVKRTVNSSSSSGSQNMAFLLSPSSTNEVDTANIQISAISTPVSTVSTHDNTANLSDATVFAFLANQPNGSQLVHEDLEQIHEDDLEEMDLKWQLALLSMRVKRYFQRTGKKITINGSDTAGYDKTKSYMADDEAPTNMALMAFSDLEVHNSKTYYNTCLKSYETLKNQYDNLRIEFNKSEFDLATYKRGLASVEEQLVFYKKNELEKLKIEKESNPIKIDNFENASKSLDKLIGSQITDTSITCLGFVSYNVVAPLPTGLFAPLTVDLSNSGLEEFKQPNFEGYGPKASKSVNGDLQNDLKDTGIFDSGCSRHMTGNKSYLIDYQEYDGGFVAFASSSKGGKINGKGKNRTGKLDFEDVYFVKELKFNFFSVSQICDKKNSVLFIETKCLILSPDFKMPDESQVLLKVPRKNNMYSFDLKNVVPSKGNLVRGLPSKIFKNDHTCVACQKGKQHKAFLVTDDYSRFSWVFVLPKKDETSGILKDFIGIKNQLNYKGKIIRCDNRTEFKNYEMNQFCRIKVIKREFSNAMTQQQNEVAERKNMTLIENRVLVTKPHNKTHYELLIGRPPIISFMRPFGCPITILNTLDHPGKFDGKANDGFLVKAFRVYNSRTRKAEENLHVNFLENKLNIVGSVGNKMHKAFPLPATPVSAAMPINTATSKPLVNVAKPRQNALQKSHSLSRRPFYPQTALKNKILNNHVNTAKADSVNTAKADSVNTAKGNKQVMLGNKRLMLLSPQHAGFGDLKLKYKIMSLKIGALQDALKDQGYFDSGYSRHMTGNISYLTDFKEHDGWVLVVKPHFKNLYELFKDRSTALSFMTPFGCHVIIINTLDQLGKFDGKSDEGIFVGYSTISKAFRVYNIRTIHVKENLHITFLENKPMIAGGRPEWLFDNDALSKLMIYAPVPAEDTGIFDDAYDDRDEGTEADYNNLKTVISVSHIPTTRIQKDHSKEQIIGEVNSAVQIRKIAKQNEAGLITFINKQRRINHKDFQSY
nr:hypothetical protein [Tanacetum cinerariifolium]